MPESNIEAVDHLYFISATAETAAEDSLDLLVHASDVSRAVVLWREYYEGWDMPNDILVYQVDGPALRDHVIAWDALPNWTIEFEGNEPVVCPSCGAVEHAPEWGTVGDGYDGYCPSCADKREEA